jgi:hypothetical protein
MGPISCIRACIGVLFVLTFASGRAPAAIEVNVTRIGYPSMEGDQVVRTGQWAPVVVDLALLDQSSFDGRIRIGQLDNDGDEAIDSLEVHLSAETGGTQRVFLYTLPSVLRGQGRFHVEVQTLDGQAVQVVNQGELTRQARPASPPRVITDDELFILSVASGTVGRIEKLAELDPEESFGRPVVIGHVSPAELPERWIGLELVDAIRWEDADPDDLTDRQLQALLDWVRQGGRLLIMASPADGSFALRKSLDAVLPADIGEVLRVNELIHVYDQLLHPTTDDPPTAVFDPPIPAVRCKRRPGATLIGREASLDSDLITRRREGRGEIIFCGLAERHLFQSAGDPIEFYRHMFQLSRVKGTTQLGIQRESLFPEVVSAVSFSRSGGLFVVLAALFSLVYVAAATFGVWHFLGARNWRQHNWSAFAVIALVASGASVAAVNSLRGFTDTLHQISIIDADAGNSHGYGTVFFGLKTGLDKRIDLWLPSDALSAKEPRATTCFLRPLPVGNSAQESLVSYADPQAYRMQPASAVLEDVRIRGTLKQFEGRWQGRIGGRISARVTLHPFASSVYDWRITDESYLVNELGVPLRDCILLQPSRDTHAPADRDSRLQNDDLRDNQIYAFSIGAIPSGPAPVYLAPLCYRPRAGRSEFSPSMDSLLRDAQDSWGAPFRKLLSTFSFPGSSQTTAAGNERNALLLLSTIGELDPLKFAEGAFAQAMGPTTFSRDRLRQLDLRESLQRDCVYLLGFAEHPGPIRLFRRQGDRPYSPLEPEATKTWTMYRIRIPVTLAANNPEGPDS